MVKSLCIRKMRYVVLEVQDNDGLTHDTTITLQVKSGAPSVTSAYCQRDTVWVKDTNRYRVKASDPNGSLKMVYVSWSGTGVAEDSIVLGANVKAVDTPFLHAWDTVGGSKTVRFWVRDDDSLVAVRDTGFTVRKGAPRLWGDKTDTLWMIVNNGAGVNYKLHVNSFDTNGTINKYYWNESGAGLTNADSTNFDTLSRRVVALEVNRAWPAWIYGRDNDGFLRGGQFVVFADSAPRPITATSDPVTGGRKFTWSGLDAKDSLATDYKIFIKRGSAPDTSATSPDVVKDWTPASDPSFSYTPANTLPFSLTYTPTQAGLYFWRIISRDARGSKCNGDLNSGTFTF